jgi:hypothetical protein
MECSRPIQHPRQGMSANAASPEPGVHETRDAPGVGVGTNTRPALEALHAAHGHRQVHTCGMDLCELTAVALTVAPVSPPRSLRRAQASTSPRRA